MSSPALTTRVFLGTAFVLVIILGSAAFAVWELGQRAATREARSKVVASASVQTVSRQQRYQQLGLLAEIVASRPDFRNGLADAIGARDRGTLLERLEHGRSELGYDVALVFDADGVLVARTDRPRSEGVDLSSTPVVRTVRAEFAAAGVWREAGRLTEVVAVPLAGDDGILGYLTLGYSISDVRALEIKRGTGAEAIFVADPAAGAVASSLAPAATERVLSLLGGDGGPTARVANGRSEALEHELRLDSGRWLAELLPLDDAAGSPVGVVVSLVSLDWELVGYRQVRDSLLLAMPAAALAALLVSLLVARWVTGPAREMAGVMAAARGGQFEASIRPRGAPEMAALAAEIGALLEEHRLGRETAELVSRRSGSSPATPRDAPAGVRREAETRDVVLLGVELRTRLRRRPGQDASRWLAGLAGDLRLISAAVAAAGGTVEAVHGHRLIAAFAGAGRSEAALAATAAIGRRVGDSGAAFDGPQPPAAALACGEMASGVVGWGAAAGETMLGLPLQKVEALLREAGDGEILISSAVHGELAGLLAGAGVELRPQRGLLSTRPLYLLDYAEAERATRAVDRTSDSVEASVAGGPGVDPEPDGLAPGSVLGERFEIVARLGDGAAGEVALARDRELGERVALASRAADAEHEGEAPGDLRDEPAAELERRRSIRHPNLVRLFDFGVLAGRRFVAMEHVAGVPLRALIGAADRGPARPPIGESIGASADSPADSLADPPAAPPAGIRVEIGLRLARQLAAALAALHERGLASGGFGAEDVVVDVHGDLRLRCVGAAWLGGASDHEPAAAAGDLREDVRRCGELLLELFTGRADPGPAAAARSEAPDAGGSGLPPALESLLTRCLAEEPQERPRDGGELLAELERVEL